MTASGWRALRVVATGVACVGCVVVWHMSFHLVRYGVDSTGWMGGVVGLVHVGLLGAALGAVGAFGVGLHEMGVGRRWVWSAVFGLPCGVASLMAVYWNRLERLTYVEEAGTTVGEFVARWLLMTGLLMAGAGVFRWWKGRAAEGEAPSTPTSGDIAEGVALREASVPAMAGAGVMLSLISLVALLVRGPNINHLLALAYAVLVALPVGLLLTALGNRRIVKFLLSDPHRSIAAMQHQKPFDATLDPGLWIGWSVLAYGLGLLVIASAFRPQLIMSDITFAMCLGVAELFAVDVLVWTRWGRPKVLPPTGHQSVGELMEAEGYRRGKLWQWRKPREAGGRS